MFGVIAGASVPFWVFCILGVALLVVFFSGLFRRDPEKLPLYQILLLAWPEFVIWFLFGMALGQLFLI